MNSQLEDVGGGSKPNWYYYRKNYLEVWGFFPLEGKRK